MGREAACEARIGRKRVRVKAHLDSTFVRLGGGVKATIPFTEMREVTVATGTLRFRFDGEAFSLELGAKEAERWAKDILHPKSRIEKLGVKRNARVAAIGISDKAFLAELREALDSAAVPAARGRYDTIFRELRGPSELDQIGKLRAHLEPNGALWLVYVKGKKAPLSESAVRDAFLKDGLVDVKVVSFSPTHTAVKVVIPRIERLTVRRQGRK